MTLNFNKALGLSLGLHLALYGLGLGWMAWRASHAQGMDIDLGASLLSRLANEGGRRAVQAPQDWLLSTGAKMAQKPQPLTVTAAVVDSDAVGPPCPPPCPMNEGDWAPAGSSAQAPRWDVNITEDDYPTAARQANVQGKVVVEVKIDVDGTVKDARLLKGTNALLDAKTLEKIRQARFTPCRDASGRPFPCKVVQPIGWVLE